VVAAVVTRTTVARAALVLFAVWLVLYFGRPTLGPLVDLLPFHEGLLLHRFIGLVDLFAVVLVGIGGAAVFERAHVEQSPVRLSLAAGLVLLLFVPAIAERASFYSLNSSWMRQTADAIAADTDASTIVADLRKLAPGRVFAGLRNADWSRALDFGIPFNSVRFSDLLVFDGLPVVAAPYSSITLNADFMWDFDPNRPDHYDLFNVRYAVAASSAQVPSFLVPLDRTPRYVLYAAPTSGYGELAAEVVRQAAPTQVALFALNRTWVNSVEPAARHFIRWDYPAIAPGNGASAASCADGAIRYERALPRQLDVIAFCPGPATVVFKVTYHPNWRALVDGQPAEVFMVSPSYVGVSIPAGTHFVSARYEPTPAKTPLFFGGLLLAAGIALAPAARRRWPARYAFRYFGRV
jgi:hypothetical protein